MKIYTKVVIDTTTGRTVQEDCFEYSGPVAQCGGGPDVSTSDEAFNARMATLSEEQQDWGRKMFNKFMYGVDYDPSEQVTGYYDDNGKFVESSGGGQTYTYGGSTYTVGGSVPAGKQAVTITRGEANGYDPEAVISEMDLMDKQIAAQFGLTDSEVEAARTGFNRTTAENESAMNVLPSGEAAAISENELTTTRNKAEQGLVQLRADLDAENIGEARQQIAARSPIIDKFYAEAGKEINVNDRMNEASADVAQSYGAARESLGRNVALRGGNIEGGAGRSMMKDLTGEAMKADAFSRTTARRNAEKEQLEKYRSAMTLGDV